MHCVVGSPTTNVHAAITKLVAVVTSTFCTETSETVPNRCAVVGTAMLYQVTLYKEAELYTQQYQLMLRNRFLISKHGCSHHHENPFIINSLLGIVSFLDQCTQYGRKGNFAEGKAHCLL